MEIDLSSLELAAQQGKFIASLDYGGVEIVSTSTILNVENPEQSATAETAKEKEKEKTEEIINETTQNITEQNVTAVHENASDYSLTEEEIAVLQAETGSSEVKITKSEIIDNRLIIRFEIGNYWLENSYDYSKDEKALIEQVELDRIKWVKRLAKTLSESASEAKTAEQFIGNFSF